MFMCSRFSFFFLFFSKGSENKLRGSRKGENNKKEKKIEHGKSCGVRKSSHSNPRQLDQIIHHTPSLLPPPKHANPKNRYTVGGRENWIFRLSKPHKTRQKSERGILVAFFLLLNLNTHIVFLPTHTSILGFHSIPDVCLKGPELEWKSRAGRSRPGGRAQRMVEEMLDIIHQSDVGRLNPPERGFLSQKSMKWKQMDFLRLLIPRLLCTHVFIARTRLEDLKM